MANFKNLSRYSNGTVTKNRAGKDFLILRKPLNLEPADSDTIIVVTQELENRPDLLAQAAYGQPELWWVIYEFNEILDPFFELRAGMVIRIPAFDRVLSAIEQLGF